MENFITSVWGEILINLPIVAAWATGVVFATIMLRRGGGMAEKLLLAGSVLMLVLVLTRPLLLRILVPWLREATDAPLGQIVWINTAHGIILGLAGFVCLVLAFRIRFRTGREGTSDA